MGYMCLFQFWFPQGICLGVGWLGHMVVGDFNTPLAPMDTSSKQKINKEAQVLNDTLDEIALTDIFRTFHPNAE